MSKTYRDQRLYQAKHYYKNRPAFWWRMPEKKSIDEPEWWSLYKYYPGCTIKKFYYRYSHKRKRQKIKHLLRQGQYTEAKHVKPENVDWMIS